MPERIPLDLDIKLKGSKEVADLREEIGGIKEDIDGIDTGKAEGQFSSFSDTVTKGMGSAQASTLLLVSGNEELASTLENSQVAFQGFAGASQLVKTGLVGNITVLKAFKIALAATGIGAIVVALGSLVAFFTKTQRGAEILNKATAALGATVSVITDRLSAFGEVLFNAFNDPQQAIKDFGDLLKTFVLNRISDIVSGFKGLGKAVVLLFEGEFKKALEVAGEASLDLLTGLVPVAGIIKDSKDAIAGLVDEINKEATAAANLQGRQDALIKRERLLNVERAQSRQRIEELKLLAEDVTKATDERLAAAEEAFAIETGLTEKTIALDKERVAIISQRLALGESLEEDLQELADAEIQLADRQAESLTKQIELNNKINSIKAEQAAKDEAARKEAEEAEAKQLEIDFQKADALLQAKELEAAEDLALQLTLLEERRRLEVEFFIGTKEELALLQAQFNDESAKLSKAKTDKDIAEEKRRKDALIASGQSLVGGLGQLGTLLAQQGQENNVVQKGLALTQIGIDTALAISALTAKSEQNPANAVTFGAAGAIQFAAGIIKILANIATAKQILGATGGAPSVSAGGGGAPSTRAPALPQLGQVESTELDIATGQPLAAVVVETQLNETQNRVRSLESNAKIK